MPKKESLPLEEGRVPSPIVIPTEQEIGTLGLREVTHYRDVVTSGENETEDGLRFDGTKIERRAQKEIVAQPVLEYEEAVKLGRQNWHPHKFKKDWTCVVAGRRFSVTEAVASRLKNDGLVGL